MELTKKEKLSEYELRKRKELGCSRQKAWRDANKARANATQKAWCAANKEKVAEYQKKKREKNKAKITEKPKHDPVAAALKRKSYLTEYRHKHPEKWSLSAKQWIKKNKEKYLNSTYYISKNLGIPASDCPSYLIDIKREHLNLYRITKQLINLLKEKSHGSQ